jgi:hypothetical protein
MLGHFLMANEDRRAASAARRHPVGDRDVIIGQDRMDLCQVQHSPQGVTEPKFRFKQ